MDKFQGVDGLKTGYIKTSGWCCTITAKRNDIRFIAVVLGSSKNGTRFNEAAKLLSYGFANFKKVTPVHKGDVVGPTIPVKNGTKDKINLVSKSDLFAMVSKKDENKLQVVYEFPQSLDAPLKVNEEKGKIILKFGETTLAEGPAIVGEDVQEKSLIQKILPF